MFDLQPLIGRNGVMSGQVASTWKNRLFRLLTGMELTLQAADVLWLAKAREAPRDTRLAVLLPPVGERDEGLPLPCSVSIPTEDLAEQKKTSLLEQPVTFQLLHKDRVVATYALKLRGCIPVLAEGSVEWTQPVMHEDVCAVSVELCSVPCTGS
ncbi:unnamed protein product [Phytophthora fragariaefolia]|uniref:Unnamed protein product n=1 Tax=Phytophthora fragariaefolia TaxID=1490495 RepID=A0A9W6XKV3_9STRA|nr:unnamed protein product [Phytophthora fragariaefolia]